MASRLAPGVVIAQARPANSSGSGPTPRWPDKRVAGALGAVPAALAGLQHLRPTMPVRTRVAYAPAGAGHVRLWAVAEIDTATSREGAWLGGGTVDAALSGADNRALASVEGALAGGQRTVLLDLGQVEVPETSTSLRVRLQPAGEGLALKDALALAPIGAAGDPGVPLLFRRGATTGTRYVPTADPQFRRTERLRVDLPRATPPGTFTAALLDRAGAPLPLPVDDDDARRWRHHVGDGRGVARPARARRLRDEADGGRGRRGDGDPRCAWRVEPATSRPA